MERYFKVNISHSDWGNISYSATIKEFYKSKKQIKISKPVWIKIKWNNSSARDQWFLYPNLNG